MSWEYIKMIFPVIIFKTVQISQKSFATIFFDDISPYLFSQINSKQNSDVIINFPYGNIA